jgi:hypothetical protein
LKKDGIELLATPFVETIGIKVFDVNGKQIGIVKSISRGNNPSRMISIIIDQKIKQN